MLLRIRSALRMRHAQGTEIPSHMSKLNPSTTYTNSDDAHIEKQLLPEYDPNTNKYIIWY